MPERPWPPWRAHGLSRHRRRVLITTWRSWAPGPPDWARPSMRRRTGSRPSCSKPTCRAARPRTPRLIENFFGFVDGIGGAELARLAGRQAEKLRCRARSCCAASSAAVTAWTGRCSGSWETRTHCRRRSRDDGDGLAEARVRRCRRTARPRCLLRRRAKRGGPVRRRPRRRGRRRQLGRPGGHEPRRFGSARDDGGARRAISTAACRPTSSSASSSTRSSTCAWKHRSTALDEADGQLGSVTLTDAASKEQQLPTRALFLCIGGVPHTEWAGGIGVRLDRAGYVLTGPDLLDDGRRPIGWSLDRDPLALETSVPGLFAAGDARSGSIKRVAAAVGEGGSAIALVYRRLEELQTER